MYRFAFLIVLASHFLEITAQVPFVCRGDYYLTLRSRQFNELFTIDIDPITQRATFSRVPGFPDGYHLNAMGYRSTDNFIYIIELNTTSLLRVHGDGSIAQLRTLSELPSLRYFAGACTPDGNYLIISGSPQDFGFGSANTNLVFIDLRNSRHETRELRMRDNRTLFFDMAFDPFTGICYSYDVNNRALITVDIEDGTTRQIGRPDQIANSMGTLFFDAFGNLFGYGRPEGSENQNTLFAIDKVTGELTVRTTGESADRSDGCSCPFTIKLSKDVFPRTTVACSEVTYTFTIANATGRVQDGIRFRDVMPEGMEIVEIINNPFGGTQFDTGNPNELFITDMVLPVGLDSLQVRVRTGRDMAGFYRNQAVLDNLSESLGLFTLSDDPTTLAEEDSTTIQVLPLEIDLSAQNKLLCSGDTLVLGGNLPFVDYLWQDRFTGPTFSITEPGTYWVELRSDCDVRYDTITVELAPAIEVYAGPDRSVTLGDSFEVDPIITGLGPFRYHWSTTDQAETLSCVSCETPTIQPFFAGTYQLRVIDGAGCSNVDAFEVEVDRNIYIWIPNAFSPNSDGINDYFYVAGRFPYLIEDFSIFSRWGERLFQNRNIQVNSEADGWNGFTFQRLSNPGVYVYKAVILLPDGSREVFSGDVTLLQ